MAELMDVAQHYTDEDTTIDSDDKYGQQRNSRSARSDGRRDDYRFGSSRLGGNKWHNDNGHHCNFVDNASYGQREPKYTRCDDRGPREERPPGKCFDAQRLLDAP
jgi:hypothetical protein